MKRTPITDDNNDVPTWKKPKETSAEEENNDQENSASPDKKSGTLTTQMDCKDAFLLQCLSNSDLTGTLKILNEARHGKCSLAQNTLDTALLSACRQGFLFVMQSLLYLGANVESSDADGNTALVLSVERKSVEMVEFLLKKGANANAVRKSTGDSCLLLAVQPGGFFDMVKLLIDHGSNIHLENKRGYTALSRAFKVGNVRVLHFLMKSGADADRCNKFGKTARSMANSVGFSRVFTSMSSVKEGVPALVKAVKMKDIQLLQILLDNKVENVDDLFWENGVSTTALELAFEKGGASPNRGTRDTLKAMITLLLKEGANVNRNIMAKDAQLAKSPLFIAAKWGDSVLIDLLIHHGAKRIPKGLELEAALMAGNVHCAESLLKKGVHGNFSQMAVHVASTNHVNSFRLLHDKCYVKATDSGLIHAALLGGHLDMVKFLIELGATVKDCDKCSMPVLCHTKNVEIVSLLVDHGADVNAMRMDCNSNEPCIFTPLAFAIREGRVCLVNFYLSHGADVTVRSLNGGLLVLQAFSVNPSMEILDMLLTAGVDINHTDRDGESVLMWAVKENKPQLLKLLIDYGADVTLADGQGITPLMHAVKSSHNTCEEIVECLINAGADVNRHDKNGNSAVIHCFSDDAACDIQNLKHLVKAGAFVNCQNEDGETALSIHLRFFSFDTTKALLEIGADVNTTDINGNTPLMTFVKTTSTITKEDLQLFLDHGADVNIVNTKGEYPTTALSLSFHKWVQRKIQPSHHITEPNNDGSIIINLLQAGADPDLADGSKFLMHWAIVYNQRSIIPTLINCGLGPYEYNGRDCISRLLRFSRGSYPDFLSPFRLALCLGRLSIAKFLAGISFFTEEDIGQGYKWATDLQGLLRKKRYHQTADYLNEFTSEPKSLVDLSSVVISAMLQNPLGRKKAVVLAGLPPMLQRRLHYTHTHVKLGSSDIDETLSSEQSNLG